MAVELNHTIIWARDSKSSAAFLAEILGLPTPARWARSRSWRPPTERTSTIWIATAISRRSTTPFW